MFALAVVIAVLSKVRLATLVTRVWLVVLAFTGVIALPAIFVTPRPCGRALGPLTVTEQGLRTAALLILRVETAVTFTTLLVLCTPWTHVLKALRALRLPKEAITMLAMTHRYVFLLVETASQMFESRRSRTLGILKPEQQRHMAARTAGVLLSKSVSLSNEVYLAMQSRGFRGDIQVLSDFRLTMWDYCGLLAFLLAGGHRRLDGKIERAMPPLFELRDVCFDYDGFPRSADFRSRLRKASGSHWSARTARASPRCCGFWTVCALPRKARSASPDSRLTAEHLADDRLRVSLSHPGCAGLSES